MKIKDRYARTRVITEIPPAAETKCRKSEKNNACINNIVAKAYKTGQLPVLMHRQPLPELPSEQTYQEMLDKVVHAQQRFEQLPASIRNAFDNDPKMLLRALENPQDNMELLLKANVLEEVKQKTDPVIAELQSINKSIQSSLPAKQSGEAAKGA